MVEVVGGEFKGDMIKRIVEKLYARSYKYFEGAQSKDI